MGIHQASNLTAIAKQLGPHMSTAASLFHTMQDHGCPVDVAPIQVAIFGLQQSQQQCLSFFGGCVKYWEKANMCCEVSTVRPTLEKLVASQRQLMENLEQAPERAQVTMHSLPLRNVISEPLDVLLPSRSLIKFLAAHDNWANIPRGRESGAINSHCGMGLEDTEDVMLGLRVFEEAGYDPFEGMSLEALERERQKWTTCRKHFESELRAEFH